MRPSPLHLVLLLAVLGALLFVVQIGVLTVAFERLGMSSASACVLVFLLLAGSLVDVPLVRIKAEAPERPAELQGFFRLLRRPPMPFAGTTLLAVNVGGGLLPVALSAYLLVQGTPPAFQAIAGVAVMSGLSYTLSRPVPGVGIGLPIVVPPVGAAALGLLIGGEHSAQLAYVSGTLGVLIGADILRLADLRRMGVPAASIGGAGTFDGIFLTGIVAALLASS